MGRKPVFLGIREWRLGEGDRLVAGAHRNAGEYRGFGHLAEERRRGGRAVVDPYVGLAATRRLVLLKMQRENGIQFLSRLPLHLAATGPGVIGVDLFVREKVEDVAVIVAIGTAQAIIDGVGDR